ncbi:alpha-actinin [Mycoemilia scoparia]|uniref:Alpha-actinin n=1 Tax=Mycoemilia scoparia TaxID=417184 RepID=A0A9W8DSK6_9FUNG|nr:alpha-actinin [Mycoemilia scoparia]
MNISSAIHKPIGYGIKNTQHMDRGWEVIQAKTFTKWVNNQLGAQNVAPINSIVTDLSDGTALIQLLEIIGDVSLGRYNRNPKLRIQRVENVNKALEFIRERRVNLTNIGAEDIVDANPKLILGMIWTIILRFTIAMISEEGLTAKDGLLLWCQRKTAPYHDVNVVDFTYSWQDGLAFCALIHRHRPDLLDYDRLDKSDPHSNTALAFEVAERYLGIPKLLDVEDVCDVGKPDERSIMTYVAQYFHAFSSLSKAETAGRRVEKFSEMLQSAYEMQHDYGRRVRALLGQIDHIKSQWEDANFDGTYADARNKSSTFINYKVTDKRRWVVEKLELETLLGNIQTKLATYNLSPYKPPAGYSTNDLEAAWDSLAKAEVAWRKTINTKIREIKTQLQRKYADQANILHTSIMSISNQLASLNGELEIQLQIINRLCEKAKVLDKSLRDLEKLDQECQDANIDENDYTVYTKEDLNFDMEMLKRALNKKRMFIENQAVVRNMSNLTPAQLEEFEATFRFFDRENTNTLTDAEFRAAMETLDQTFKDDEFADLFIKVSEGRDYVTFEQYIHFLVSITEDQTTPEQLQGSFRVVSDDKDYVTVNDLQSCGISPSAINHLTTVMPRAGQDPNAYDYISYLNSAFNN